MNARELKVRDWVLYEGDYYPITNSSDDVIPITNENNFEIFSVRNLEPITLSREILEKNGWKHHVDNGKHCYTKAPFKLENVYFKQLKYVQFLYSFKK